MSDKNPGISLNNWIGGCNSLIPPDQILPNQYSWLINGVNRGGIVQTRPGYRYVSPVTGSRAQGAVIFTPLNSRPMMLVAVDGAIMAAQYPYTEFSKLSGVSFSPTAPIINFQVALKSATLGTDGKISLITPKPIVIIQDGVTRAATFDGSTAAHSTAGAPFYGIPIGLWMAWTSSRLWVFSGSSALVSDIADPDTFFENTYIAEQSNFSLPATVTGAIETTDRTSLLVFTDSTTTTFQSSIRDRTLWQQTPNFQSLLLPSIGCVAGRSAINQFGETWWMSRRGLINIDAALYSQRTSKLQTIDGEMMRSKRIMAPDQSGICSAVFENFLLCSVPAGGRYNEQTWVADQAPIGQAGNGAGMAWAGIWTGIRPVVWMRDQYLGRERLYCLTYDATPRDETNIHIWEAFRSDRKDNGGSIACQMETAMITASEFQRFQYAEIDMCEILGNVSMQVYVGGIRGQWYKIKDTTLQAEIGSLKKNKLLTKSTLITSFKPQSRQIKTEQFSTQDRTGGAESSAAPGLDKGFQLLIQWTGRAGIKSVKFIMEPEETADGGECVKGEAGEHNAINDRGETIAI